MVSANNAGSLLKLPLGQDDTEMGERRFAMTVPILLAVTFLVILAGNLWLYNIGPTSPLLVYHGVLPNSRSLHAGDSASHHPISESRSIPRPPVSRFGLGTPKPPNANYSRVVVVPRMKKEDIDWFKHELPDTNLVVYVVDDHTAANHPPRNKGHEVMVYLTYIVDHYWQLPDTIIFMHAHRWSHHNNELLGADATTMIRRLNDNHVAREGYMNVKCEWYPGCPKWLEPTNLEDDLGKQEQKVLSKCWHELFPFHPLPRFLAQPCCAQFALSRQRVLSIPLSQFTFYRDWMLRTPLSDYISGRIWEYSWQFALGGRSVRCPAEHQCYCDGYGVCFGGPAQYAEYLHVLQSRKDLEHELQRMRETEIVDGKASHDDHSSSNISVQGGLTETVGHMEAEIEYLSQELSERKADALKRGNNPRERAVECERPWQEGDGF